MHRVHDGVLRMLRACIHLVEFDYEQTQKFVSSYPECQRFESTRRYREKILLNRWVWQDFSLLFDAKPTSGNEPLRPSHLPNIIQMS